MQLKKPPTFNVPLIQSTLTTHIRLSFQWVIKTYTDPKHTYKIIFMPMNLWTMKWPILEVAIFLFFWFVGCGLNPRAANRHHDFLFRNHQLTFYNVYCLFSGALAFGRISTIISSTGKSCLQRWWLYILCLKSKYSKLVSIPYHSCHNLIYDLAFFRN